MFQQSNTYTIACNIPKTGAASEMRPLAVNFQPGPMDVICRRGKTAYNHNKHFRELIEKHLQKYSQATSKLEKSLVVSEVVDTIRENSPFGGFVRCIDGVWYEVGDSIAREKCGGSFRDMLHTQYKSSTKAKKRRRAEEEAKEANSIPSTIQQLQQQSTPKTAPAQPKKKVVVVEPVPSQQQQPSSNKRRRVEAPAAATTTTALPPLSPKSTKVLCAFGDLLKDIQSRKQVLTDSPLQMKKPLLPPPARFPSAPKMVSVMRGCSVESTLSFDIDEMEEMDEFEYGLSRFTSVASAGSIFSFKTQQIL